MTTLPNLPFNLPPLLVPQKDLATRGLKVLDHVRQKIKDRIGHRLFARYGGWPWTDERMRQIVMWYCNEYTEVLHRYAQARRYLTQPPLRPDLEDERFEAHLAAYLIGISHCPGIDVAFESDGSSAGRARERTW